MEGLAVFRPRLAVDNTSIRSFRNVCLPRLEIRLILTDTLNEIDYFSLYDY